MFRYSQLHVELDLENLVCGDFTAEAEEHDHDHELELDHDHDHDHDHAHGPGDALLKLRIAAIFILLVTSGLCAVFPIIAKRSRFIPAPVYNFAKYFGSGVIIATAFIHLLVPAFEHLNSPCLTGAWTEYPWPAAISMGAVFFIFYAELIAFRWGTARLKKLGGGYDAHGHELGVEGTHAAHGPETQLGPDNTRISKEVDSSSDQEQAVHVNPHQHYSPLGQIVSVTILEFGVVFHSVLLGLTLAVDEDFKVLFAVIVFHQMFEGLGLGTRLAALNLPPSYAWAPWVGALMYALTTPIGLAAGLGIRTTYNPGSATSSKVTGVFDAFSSGILLYTGLVELLAHEFIFNKEMREASTGRVAYAGGCVLLGAGIMALLGKWA